MNALPIVLLIVLVVGIPVSLWLIGDADLQEGSK